MCNDPAPFPAPAPSPSPEPVPPNAQDGNQFKDFLNPRSAITIGGSSAMVLAFTTSLCSSFHWPAAIVALVLSAVFAGVQMAYVGKTKLWTLPLYWVICTLVIFHAARGGNETLSDGGDAISPTNSPKATPQVIEISSDLGYPSSGFGGLFVMSAYGDSEAAVSQAVSNAVVAGQHTNHLGRFFLSRTNEEGWLVYTNLVGKEYSNMPPAQANSPTRVFKKWHWSGEADKK